jgi:hypothetical protein
MGERLLYSSQKALILFICFNAYVNSEWYRSGECARRVLKQETIVIRKWRRRRWRRGSESGEVELGIRMEREALTRSVKVSEGSGVSER